MEKILALTEEELREIEELKKDKAVKVAQKANREKYGTHQNKERYKEKQKLYMLRHLKKKGEQILGGQYGA